MPIVIRALQLGLAVAAASLAPIATGCDDVDDRPATWSYIHVAILRPGCTTSNCHSTLAATAGLTFDDREDAYALLTGRVCGAPELPGDPPGNFVFPYQPERSRLLHLLRGEQTIRMPPDVPLPPVEIELIRRWIEEGATCD